MLLKNLQAAEPGEHCAYCEAPLPAATAAADGNAGHAARYCCYGCRLLGESGQKPAPELNGESSPWFRIILGAAIAGQAMLLGLAVNLAPPEGLARLLLHSALIVSSLAVFGLLGAPLLRSAVQALREHRPSVELLFLAGIAGAFFASVFSTWRGRGDVYYEVVAILLTVYALGKTLGARCRARALAESRKLQDTFDVCQRIDPDGQVTRCPVAAIAVGDRVRILPGEPIPIDGQLERGQAFICETPLTGEPFPVVRRPGDSVFAGAYSEDGELVIRATVTGHRRRLDSLLALLDQARESSSSLQTQADRVVRWFLPVVLLAALGTFTFWTIQSSWSSGLFNALAVLLVACPCAMGLATPIAIWNGLAVLAARGLVVRGGDAIERLAALTDVVFDKTGTLSEEALSLIDLAVVGEPLERQRLVRWLHAVQRQSSHPVARAFQNLQAPGAPEDPGLLVRGLKTIPARGVEGWLQTESGEELHLRIGQRELMNDLSTEPALLESVRHRPGDHLVYVQVDGRLEAIAAVRERLRLTSEEALDRLKECGVAWSVMTGDTMARADGLGLKNVVGGLTPEQKAGRLDRLHQAGRRTGFVGDGINDAPAMRAASLGIALAHGAGVTTASAGAILYGSDLRVIPWAIVASRRVCASIRSNLLFAAAYNLAGIGLAATGYLHPVMSAVLMVLSSFTVAWRALRSAEADAACCVGPAPSPNPPVPTEMIRPRTSLRAGAIPTGELAFRTRCAYGILFATQAPFLAYLGRLTPVATAVCCLSFVLGGCLIVFFRSRNEELRRYLNMTYAMLAAGNWGMILGWWYDAGFQPVALAAPCCAQYGTFSLAGVLTMPGMNVGMLLFGLPPMLWDGRNLRDGLGRLGLGVLSAVGMVYGMSFGHAVFLKWLGADPASRFLVAYAGMTVGMLMGMFFGCELGRAVVLWKRSLRHR